MSKRSYSYIVAMDIASGVYMSSVSTLDKTIYRYIAIFITAIQYNMA